MEKFVALEKPGKLREFFFSYFAATLYDAVKLTHLHYITLLYYNKCM